LLTFAVGRLVSSWEAWRHLLAFAWRIGLAGVLSLHGFWWLLVRYWRRQGRLTPNIVIVGANASAARLVRAALRSRDVAVLGVFDDRLNRAPRSLEGVPILGDSKALLDHRILPSVDRIVVAVSQDDARSRVRDLIERLSAAPNEVCLILDSPPDPSAFSRIADTTLTRVSGPAADANKAFSKRVQDLVIGALALAVAAPAMLCIALAIKLDSPGPIFFRQRRHGFNNEEILIWKFRSMRHEPDGVGPLRQAIADDERVTEVGRMLRGKSLDELPQLFNVLRGEMSLVGPRPHAIGMRTGDTDSANLVAKYAHRHRIKPGMTGWAAVNGSRGPVDTPELVRRRVALDIEYIERQSFWMDLRIMAATVPCLLGDRSMVR
jgi:exopolysaccharide biosynthesis polyprenyl glycosylphosphotransferase